MATHEHELTSPPQNERGRELWLQHAAGFILFRDSRQYAVDQIDAHLDPKARAAVVKGIDDALYGLMMIIDGVSGRLSNASEVVSLTMLVRHSRRSPSGSVSLVQELDLQEGDGMCMGIHGWRTGDFGKQPPAAVRRAKPNQKSPRVRPRKTKRPRPIKKSKRK